MKAPKLIKNTNITSNVLVNKLCTIVRRYYKKKDSFSYIKKAVEKHTNFILESFVEVKASKTQVSVPLIGSYLFVEIGDKQYMFIGYTKRSVYHKVVEAASFLGLKASKSIFSILNLMASSVGIGLAVFGGLFWILSPILKSWFYIGKIASQMTAAYVLPQGLQPVEQAPLNVLIEGGLWGLGRVLEAVADFQ